MAYHVISHTDIEYIEIANDLNIPLEHVEIYFDNYHIFKAYPIRTLTFEEENLINTINQVKTMTDHQLKQLIQENRINTMNTVTDPLHVERMISRFYDEDRYSLVRKYQKYILEPAMLYGNFTAPLTKPLSMQEIAIHISNMAMGITKDGNDLDPKTRLSALSKLADMYATDRLISNQEKTIDPTLFDDVSPDQLTLIIDNVMKKTKKPQIEIKTE